MAVGQVCPPPCPTGAPWLALDPQGLFARSFDAAQGCRPLEPEHDSLLAALCAMASFALFNTINVLVIASGVAAMSPDLGSSGSTLAASTSIASACPCDDASLCRPVATQHRREVFGFAVLANESYDRQEPGSLPAPLTLSVLPCIVPRCAPQTAHLPWHLNYCISPPPAALHPSLPPPPVKQLRLGSADHGGMERRPAAHVHSARSGGTRRARRPWRQLTLRVCQRHGARSVDSGPGAVRPGAAPGWHQL